MPDMTSKLQSLDSGGVNQTFYVTRLEEEVSEDKPTHFTPCLHLTSGLNDKAKLSRANNPARAKGFMHSHPKPILTCTVLLRNVVVNTDVIHSDPTQVSFPDFTFKNHLKK